VRAVGEMTQALYAHMNNKKIKIKNNDVYYFEKGSSLIKNCARLGMFKFETKSKNKKSKS
jgi:hypothetical protein